MFTHNIINNYILLFLFFNVISIKIIRFDSYSFKSKQINA